MGGTTGIVFSTLIYIKKKIPRTPKPTSFLFLFFSKNGDLASSWFFEVGNNMDLPRMKNTGVEPNLIF